MLTNEFVYSQEVTSIWPVRPASQYAKAKAPNSYPWDPLMKEITQIWASKGINIEQITQRHPNIQNTEAQPQEPSV